jgi:ABC-type glycerol-3-phosphate transport system permease component
MAISDSVPVRYGVVDSKRNRFRRIGWDLVGFLVLLAFFGIFLVPILWIWAAALKTSREIARNPFGLPADFQWGNLERAWTVGHFDRYMGNTVIYCVAIVGGVVFFSCLAGYALALLPLPARGAILVTFLLGLMVPFQSVMVPLYYLLRDIHLLQTY